MTKIQLTAREANRMVATLKAVINDSSRLADVRSEMIEALEDSTGDSREACEEFIDEMIVNLQD